MCLSSLSDKLISARYLIYVPARVKKKDKSGADFRCLTFIGAPPKRNVSKAQVAELVDALASGASVRMDVEVRVFSWAPFSSFIILFGFPKHPNARRKPLPHFTYGRLYPLFLSQLALWSTNVINPFCFIFLSVIAIARAL